MVDEAELRHRRRILLVMLTALSWGHPPGGEPELIAALHGWLGGWPGIGRIVLGIMRQGYDLELRRYGEAGWRATFYPAGREHSNVIASAWEATPLACRPARGVGNAGEGRAGGAERALPTSGPTPSEGS
jgi:hypothetical protein